MLGIDSGYAARGGLYDATRSSSGIRAIEAVPLTQEGVFIVK